MNDISLCFVSTLVSSVCMRRTDGVPLGFSMTISFFVWNPRASTLDRIQCSENASALYFPLLLHILTISIFSFAAAHFDYFHTPVLGSCLRVRVHKVATQLVP